ncbi:MAG: GHKL domain-containing protein [Gammaproteobacteria bacterium]|nr:GHKL domain-containing protein [Gammaproteobacteria bacterium]
MHAIQSRLATGLILSLTFLLLVQWIIISSSIHYLSEQYISSRLVHDSDTIIAALNIIPGNPNVSLADNQISAIYKQPFSGHYFEIKTERQTLRSRSLWDETLPLTNITKGQANIIYIPGPQQQQLIVLLSVYQKKGQTVKLAIAEDVSEINRDIQGFLFRHSGVSFLVFMLLVLLQVLIIKRSLKPLEQVRNDLQKLETGEIDSLSEAVPSELKPLVQELNLRLDAMAQRLKRSRHTAGNLAHALKGRLTLITQALNAESAKSDSTFLKNLNKYTNELQQIIHRELVRARVAGAGIGARQAKLAPEITALVKTLSTIYNNKSINISQDVPEQATCSLEREDLHELLGNILDNACKWATQQVHISVQENSNVRYIIDDDGPGCQESELASLSTRGVRLDEQVSGYGLGLAIVKDIVNSYEGSIHFSRSSSLGGLRVTVSIPKKHALTAQISHSHQSKQ